MKSIKKTISLNWFFQQTKKMICPNVLENAIYEYHQKNKDIEIYSYSISEHRAILYMKNIVNNFSGYYDCKNLDELNDVLRGDLYLIMNKQ